MNSNQLLNAYFAGLIDGEGTIAIYPQKYQSNPRALIKVNMTCKVTLDALHKHFGGSLYTKKVKEGYQPQWRWEVTALKARAVAECIIPFLITKKAEAQKILDLPLLKKGRRTSP